MPSMAYIVNWTLLSLNLLIYLAVYELNLNEKSRIGMHIRKKITPISAGHPIRQINIVIDPKKMIGNPSETIMAISLCSNIAKSLERRLVIFPTYVFFITKELNFDILA